LDGKQRSRSVADLCDDEVPMGQDPAHAAARTQEPSVLDEAELEEDLEEGDIKDLGSLDALLAETGQGWGIDAQLLTLKQAPAPPAAAPVPEKSSPQRIHPPKNFSKAPPPLRRAPPPAPTSSAARVSESMPARAPADPSQPGALIDLLQAR